MIDNTILPADTAPADDAAQKAAAHAALKLDIHHPPGVALLYGLQNFRQGLEFARLHFTAHRLMPGMGLAQERKQQRSNEGG